VWVCSTYPVSYVLSLNLHRRQLTPSQRAMVGARAREIYDRGAKERQKAHGETAPGKKRTLPATSPEVLHGESREAAGRAVGVGGKSIDSATRVLTNGIPGLAQAVDEGRLPVSTAGEIAKLPPEQ
jgi:hypothetical protein